MLEFRGERHSELVEVLLSAYRDTTSEADPRMVILSGEAGFGKTRIVQEFYRRLAEVQDKEYWPPDGLDTESAAFIKGRKLIHPNTVTRDALPEYMWWAISCQQGSDGDPIQALADDQTQLKQHCGPILEAVLARQDGWDRVWSLVLTGVNMSSVFPIVSWISTASGIVGNIKALVEDFQKRNPRVRGVEEVDANDNQRADLVDALFHFVSVVSSELPMVLLIDDAHDADESCVRLVRRILEPDSGVRSVLIVATLWRSKLGEESSEGSFGSLVNEPGLSHTIKQYPVPKLTDREIGEILDGLDGVTSAVAERLAPAMRKCTAGNPLLLNGVLNTEWVGDALAGGELQATDLVDADLPSTATDVFRDSWKEMPKTTRDALALSSFQGFRFLAEITDEIARHRKKGEKVSAALPSAVDPFGWAETFSEAFQFSQSDFFRIASERGAEILSPTAQEEARRDGLAWLEEWLGGQTDQSSKDLQMVARSVALHLGSQLDLTRDVQEDPALPEFVVECSRCLVDLQVEKGLSDGCLKTIRDGIKLVEGIYGAKTEEVMKLQIDWGKTCRHLGEYEAGIELYEGALATSQRIHNLEGEKAARLGLCNVYCDVGRYKDARMHSEWFIYAQEGIDLEIQLNQRINRGILNRCMGHGGDANLTRRAAKEMFEVIQIRERKGISSERSDELELRLSAAENEAGPMSDEAFEASVELALCYIYDEGPFLAQADFHLERARLISANGTASFERRLEVQIAKADVEVRRGRIDLSERQLREARDLWERVPEATRSGMRYGLDSRYLELAEQLGISDEFTRP